MAYSVGKNHASMHRFYQKAFNDTSGVLQKWRWVYAKDVAKGLKVPCLFMITEVSIPGGWYTTYTRQYTTGVIKCLLIESVH